MKSRPAPALASLAEKIREQARRTRELVTNLLSFARQVPAEKQLLDLTCHSQRRGAAPHSRSAH